MDKLKIWTENQNSEKFYSGTKANLKLEQLMEPGFNSNYRKRNMASTDCVILG
ncbi:MAG: hypothetical protein WAS55_12805 [Saprospiraceae bacterium]